MFTGDFGSSFSNLVVILIALGVTFWLLKWSNAKGWIHTRRNNQRMRIVERVILDRANSLYLIELGQKWFIVGTGEKSSPQLIMQVPYASNSSNSSEPGTELPPRSEDSGLGGHHSDPLKTSPKGLQELLDRFGKR